MGRRPRRGYLSHWQASLLLVPALLSLGCVRGCKSSRSPIHPNPNMDYQLKAEAQRARALRDQTKSTWERVKSIVDQGAGAPQDLDDATAALKVAEANLALAETLAGAPATEDDE